MFEGFRVFYLVTALNRLLREVVNLDRIGSGNPPLNLRLSHVVDQNSSQDVNPNFRRIIMMRSRQVKVRAIMTLVAGIAVLSWSYVMWQRSTRYLKMAQKHERLEIERETEFYMIEHNKYRIKGQITIDKKLDEMIAVARHRFEIERDLAARYRRASRMPWLSVEPDPPS